MLDLRFNKTTETVDGKTCMYLTDMTTDANGQPGRYMI